MSGKPIEMMTDEEIENYLRRERDIGRKCTECKKFAISAWEFGIEVPKVNIRFECDMQNGFARSYYYEIAKTDEGKLKASHLIEFNKNAKDCEYYEYHEV